MQLVGGVRLDSISVPLSAPVLLNRALHRSLRFVAPGVDDILVYKHATGQGVSLELVAACGGLTLQDMYRLPAADFCECFRAVARLVVSCIDRSFPEVAHGNAE